MSHCCSSVVPWYGTRIKKVIVLRAYYAYGYGRTTLTAAGTTLTGEVGHLAFQIFD